MNLEDRPIGFFDSGVGGISVLKEAIKVLPNEDFIYFGDSKNAPYGTKSVEEVKKLTFEAADYLISKSAKALVIACNTATSAAISDLRAKFSNHMPVIGIEPALKPAVEYNRTGKIIIMATPMTLAEAKFNNLMEKYKSRAEIVPLPCPGLVELIEEGIIEGEEVYRYLHEKMNPFKQSGIAAVVLGCTHYPFINKELVKVLDKGVPIIDGSMGTAKQLKKQLLKYSIISKRKEPGKIEITNSIDNNEIIDLSYKLLSECK